MLSKLVSLLSIPRRVLARWYILASIAIALGVAAGLLFFTYIYPGQPKIGVIEIPFTVISEDSASAT